jgi:hypothetical protein
MKKKKSRIKNCPGEHGIRRPKSYSTLLSVTGSSTSSTMVPPPPSPQNTFDTSVYISGVCFNESQGKSTEHGLAPFPNLTE